VGEVGGEDGEQHDHQDHPIHGRVEVPENLRKWRPRHEYAGATVDVGGQPCQRGENKRYRQGGEGEDLSAEPAKTEHHQTEGQAADEGCQSSNGCGSGERPAVFSGEDRHRVDPDSKPGPLPEAEVPGEPGEHVPA
jgi:hypothetical protein